jgi:F0F1-type ATP synthase membrane subunit c/vacuolar-type H+-ATPase subunit K
MKKYTGLFILLWIISIPLYANTLQSSFLNMSGAIQVMIVISFIAISLGIMSSGYALSISLGAYAACEEKNRSKAFVPAVLPSSQGLYSFVIFFMMMQQVSEKPIQVIFAGFLCGIPCLFSAIGQAKTAAACIKSINNEQMNIGNAVIATGMPELYALTGLSGAFLFLSQS